MDNIFGDKMIKVIRHAGDLNEIQLEDGVKVRRHFKVNAGADIGEVQTAPYDNHFIFRHVFKKGGKPSGWTLWCTCGSPAAVVGYDAYKEQASNSGQMAVCLFHAGNVTGQSGRHADGSS